MSYKATCEKIKYDYRFRTFIIGCFSLFVTLCFAIYNGCLFLLYESPWNGSICIYYVLLSIIRFSIILIEKERKAEDDKTVFKVFIITSILIFILNIALVIPIYLMVVNQKEVNIGGLIPAIAMATYTTYKITMATINFKKTRSSHFILIQELRTISLIDALVSILTLQNTLIVVNGSVADYDMFVLSAISSATILALIIFISIVSFCKALKKNYKKQL